MQRRDGVVQAVRRCWDSLRPDGSDATRLMAAVGVAALAAVVPLVLRQLQRGGPSLGETALLLAAGGPCAVAVLAAASSRFGRRVIGRAEATSVAGLRIGVCGVALAVVIGEPIAEIVQSPTAKRTTMGVMDLLYAAPTGLDGVAASPTFIFLLKAATSCLLIAGLVGWRVRWVLPTAAVLMLVLGGIGRSYLKFTHFGLTPTMLVGVMGLLPCADAWGLDARRRGGRRPGPSLAYGWSRVAVWLTIATPYAAAGLSKWVNGGPGWGGAHNMRAILFNHGLRPQVDYPWLGLLLLVPPLGFWAMGTGSVLLEVSMIATPFSRWARRVLPAMTASMHVGIYLLMDILFWDLVLLMGLFYDWRQMARRGLKLVGREGRLDDPAPSRGSTPRPPPHRARAPRLTTLAMFVTLTVAWAGRVEWYPWTAMQMFSGYHANEDLEHTRLFAVLASGTVRPVDRERDGLPRLGRNLARRAFTDPKERDRVGELLTASQAEGDDPVVAFELRRYVFPLDGSERDPFGMETDRLVFPIATTDARQPAHSPEARP